MSAEQWAEVYKAVRAHELMLNEATSKFEHASLTPLVTLNGGAIVAFLTLLGADADIAWQRTVAGVAIAVWGVGLLAATFAVHYAQDQQRAISKGHRLMRQQVEGVFFGKVVTDITRPPPKPDKEASSFLPWRKAGQKRNRARDADLAANVDERDERKQLREEAQLAGERMRDWRALSLLAFGGGAAVALAAILS